MYFVMLNQQNLKPTPLLEWKPKSDRDKAGVAYFETIEEAERSAQDNPLGEAYGYEIFKLGNSVMNN